MTDTVNIWVKRTMGSVRCLPEQAYDIGVMCYNAQQRNEYPNNVWHQSAKYFGHQCNCAVCAKDRIEKLFEKF